MNTIAAIVCVLLVLAIAYMALPTPAWLVVVAVVAITAAIKGVRALTDDR